jgi:hypothetical protein
MRMSPLLFRFGGELVKPARAGGRVLSFWLCLCLYLVCPRLQAASSTPVDFAKEIRPILSDNCFTCHGPDKDQRKANLRLDTKEDAFKQSKSGAYAIVPGKPEESLLLKLVSLPAHDDDRMPPEKTGKSLSSAQIDALRNWIIQGAPWSDHWAYVVPSRPALPPVKQKSWVRNEVDRFVLAELESAGLEPNPEADRYTLARRLALDLTGLPPTPDDVDAFVRDESPLAVQKWVNRLLESPHFGERLALAWLDQARYADSSGYHFDGFRQMHLWRDWVIQAFNDNKPFDQFTIEQLAGDLLPNATIDQKIATGFHRNVMTTDEGGVDPEEYMAKYCVDRVSTTAQVWLGTTMGCAECHDHKYDPISTKEFYQMYSFFHSVPERGLDGTRTRNPAPVLKVPSQEQGARLVSFLDSIPAAERKLAEREADLPKAQQRWEEQVRSAAPTPVDIPGLSARLPLDGTDLLQQSLPGSGATTPLVRGEAPLFEPGCQASALRLSGSTNHYLEITSAPAIESTNAFSYGAWIRAEARSGAILSKMEPAPTYRGFDLLLSEGKLEVHLVNAFPENALKVSTKETISTNAWHHVFVTYDGSRKAAGVKVYVDGSVRSVDVPHDKLSNSIATSTPLLIGTRVGAFAFRGSLDEVRFYDRVLAPDQVKSLVQEVHLAWARIPQEQRTAEQRHGLQTAFRETHAQEFIAADQRLKRLRADKEALLSQIPDTMVMAELETPRDTFVLVRGNFQSKGEQVHPATPASWPPLPTDQPTNRLALARWIVSTNNPLTARVTVNRYWAMLFGTGLVKTSNDFGSQGDRPSHPELLDWLASEFMQPTHREPASLRIPTPQPWDIKHMIRLLVTSAAYRQSATVSAGKLEKDPYNRRISRGPRHRLEAELIRDNALAISGLLNPTIGGPSIKPYQPPGIWSGTDHTYEPSKGSDLYRRGMYVFWKRAAHYPSFQTFDAPSRETCTMIRPRTSTPLQSLVVMNDPVYVEASRALAARVMIEAGADVQDQIKRAFRLTLARPALPEELAALSQAYQVQRETFLREPQTATELLSVGESPRPAELDPINLAALTGVANVLLNLNETLTR